MAKIAYPRILHSQVTAPPFKNIVHGMPNFKVHYFLFLSWETCATSTEWSDLLCEIIKYELIKYYFHEKLFFILGYTVCSFSPP